MAQAVRYQKAQNYIPAFIDKYYDVAFKGCIEKAASAREFLLVNRPDCLGYDEINSLFINICSGPKDLILTERVPSMKKIRAKESIATVKLRTQAKIVGWDWPRLENHYSKETKTLNLIALKLRVFTQLLFCSSSQTEKKAIVLVLMKGEELHKELFSLIRLKPGQNALRAKELRENSMIATLQATESCSRKFLIAGAPQLDPKFPCSRNRQAFFDFLNRRQAVVLIPKAAQVKIMEEEQKAKILQILKSMPTL